MNRTTTVTALGALATAFGVAGLASAQDATITKLLTDGDRVVPIGEQNAWEFTISVDSSTTSSSDRGVHDTVPAEWSVTGVRGNPDLDVLIINCADFQADDPDCWDGNPPTDADIDDFLAAGNAVVVELANKKDRRRKEKLGESATKIWWAVDTAFDTATIAVDIESRIRPQKSGGNKRRAPSQGDDKFAPTSCGVYELNDGAMLFNEEPLIPELLATSNPLCIAAVPDLGDTDTDDDGLGDFDEALLCTDPCIEDTDFDGLNDGDEVDRGTDPLNPDTDGDMLEDGPEVDIGSDPLDSDTDDDGVKDGADTCPLIPSTDSEDSDDDGTPDTSETNDGLCDPLDP